MTYTPMPQPGAAFATISDKTGRGRRTTGEPKVPEVETLECDGLPLGTHELANDPRGRTACRWCGGEWWFLDAQGRGAA